VEWTKLAQSKNYLRTFREHGEGGELSSSVIGQKFLNKLSDSQGFGGTGCRLLKQVRTQPMGTSNWGILGVFYCYRTISRLATFISV